MKKYINPRKRNTVSCKAKENNVCVLDTLDEKHVISNHSGHGYDGSENFEHDGNGAVMNYSGMEDCVYTALAEHADWEVGYDY